MFDVSVGGHYAAGEDAREAGPREITEELGLNSNFRELVPLGRRIFVHCFSSGSKECEFQDVFLLPRDLELNQLKLQKEELDGALQVDIEEGIKLFSGREREIKAPFIDLSGRISQVRVSADEFVPCLDRYYLKLLLLAKKYSKGPREPLAI